MSGKPKFVSEENLIAIRALRAQGLPFHEISDRVGIPRERVRQIALRNGLPSRVPISLSLATYDHLDPLWLAEFRGFFCGEGCASVNSQSTGRRRQYQPRLAISVREDDKDVILDIHAHLGGNVLRWKRDNRASSQPAAQWQLVGYSKLTNLLPLLLAGSLPAKKKRDLELLYRMCQARAKMPYNLTDEHSEELRGYYEALRFIKRFQGTDG